MKISVVYALPDRQIVRELELPNGATAALALRESGLLKEFRHIIPATATMGIYGMAVSADTLLQDGDRLEVYRPLNIEPEAARRLRSKKR